MATDGTVIFVTAAQRADQLTLYVANIHVAYYYTNICTNQEAISLLSIAIGTYFGLQLLH